MKKQKNISDLLNASSLPRKDKEEMEKYIRDRKTAKFLSVMRVGGDISQKEMATKLNCSQAKISKLEHATNKQISIKDIADYVRALDSHLIVEVRPNSTTIVDEIKMHAVQVKELMDSLAHLAHKDEKILEGVTKFYGEYLFNILNMYEDSKSKLKIPKESIEPIQLSSPISVEDKSEVVSK